MLLGRKERQRGGWVPGSAVNAEPAAQPGLETHLN